MAFFEVVPFLLVLLWSWHLQYDCLWCWRCFDAYWCYGTWNFVSCICTMGLLFIYRWLLRPVWHDIYHISDDFAAKFFSSIKIHLLLLIVPFRPGKTASVFDTVAAPSFTSETRGESDICNICAVCSHSLGPDRCSWRKLREGARLSRVTSRWQCVRCVLHWFSDVDVFYQWWAK